MSRLTGGSQAESQVKSESESSNYGSFFKPGVRSFDLSPKSTGFFRILPAFDYRLSSSDQLFKSSFVPYRDESLNPDPETETPGFTDWFFPVLVHKYFGKASIKYASPKNGNNSKSKGVDPLQDCFYYCYNKNKDGDFAYAKYYDKKKYPGAYLAMPSLAYFMNCVYKEDENAEEQVFILTMTSTGFNALKHTLSEKRDYDAQIISETWKRFLYGDITHPEEGCWLNPIVVQFQSEHKPAGLYPSVKKSSLQGYKSDKRLLSNPSTISLLESRYDIADTDNVTDIWDYQRVVDFLVDDGGLPIDLIKNSCSDYADIKSPRKNLVSVTNQVEDDLSFSKQEPARAPTVAPSAVSVALNSVSPVVKPVVASTSTNPVERKNELLEKLQSNITLTSDEYAELINLQSVK